MNSEIISLINLYYENHSGVDQLFFYRLIDILNDKYNCKNNSFVVFTKKKGTCYNHSLRILYININDIYKGYYFLTSKYKTLLEEKEKELLLYYLCVESVFHEFNHILQYLSLNKNDHSIENKLINLSFVNYNKIEQLKPNYQLFKQACNLEYLKKDLFYYLTPTERLANIKSINQCINLIDDHKLRKEFRNIYLYTLFLHEKRGYLINNKENIKPPLEQYLDIRDEIACKTNFTPNVLNITPTNLTTQKKILYGLDISYDELKEYFNMKYPKILKK